MKRKVLWDKVEYMYIFIILKALASSFLVAFRPIWFHIVAVVVSLTVKCGHLNPITFLVSCLGIDAIVFV